MVRQPATADQLFADAARDAAEVMRSELALDGLHRAPQRRLALLDLATVIVAGVSLVVAAGAATASIVLGLSGAVRPWLAAAIAAAAWGIFGIVTLRGPQSKRLLELVAPEVHDDEAIASAEAVLNERIEVLRATTRDLARALQRELVARQREAAVAAVERVRENLVHELVTALLAPARLGRQLLRLPNGSD